MAETDRPKCERSHQEALSQRCDTKAWELEGAWVCGCVRGVCVWRDVVGGRVWNECERKVCEEEECRV